MNEIRNGFMMIRKTGMMICALAMLATVPAFAEGFFLPWAKRDKAAEVAPTELAKPPEDKSLFGSLFLGEKTPKSVQAQAAETKKITVGINNIIVELDPMMLGTQGPGPQTADELRAVAIVQNAPLKEAAQLREQQTQKRLAQSKIAYQKQLKAQELAAERNKNAPRVVPAALDQNAQPAAASAAAKPAATSAPQKPSLFVGKPKAPGDSPAQDKKPPGVFKDF
jgi:hypothetical protein